MSRGDSHFDETTTIGDRDHVIRATWTVTKYCPAVCNPDSPRFGPAEGGDIEDFTAWLIFTRKSDKRPWINHKRFKWGERAKKNRKGQWEISRPIELSEDQQMKIAEQYEGDER